MVKNLPANAEDTRDANLIPGLGRSPGESSGNLLQYSFLRNPMDRGAWRATVHEIARVRHSLATQRQQIHSPLSRKIKSINLQYTSILTDPSKKLANGQHNTSPAIGPPSQPSTPSLLRRWTSMNHNRLPSPRAFKWVHHPRT